MNFQPTIFGSTRQQGGARARHAGKEFESLILASQNDAAGPVCVLEPIKNFAKRIGSKKWQDDGVAGGRYVNEARLIEEKSPMDFTGSVWGSGRGIHMDAKSCSEDAASFRVNDPKIVKPHQIDSLQNLERAGGIAGFMVRCMRDRVYLWLPASKARSDKPLRWDDERFLEFGAVRDGFGVPLRALIEHLENQ